MATNQNQTSNSGSSVPTIVKVLGAITGLVAAIAGLLTAFGSFSPPPTIPTPTPNSNQSIGASTPTVPATPNPTWKVIINSSATATTYSGYTTYSGNKFLIINASFENDATTSQVLSGKLFDLQDSSGQHYQESQASDPGQSFAVDVGQSINTDTTFVIPDSQCNYELSFIAGSSIVSRWTINTC